MNLLELFYKVRPFVLPYKLLVAVTLVLTLIGALTAQVNALTLQYAVDRINAVVFIVVAELIAGLERRHCQGMTRDAGTENGSRSKT